MLNSFWGRLLLAFVIFLTDTLIFVLPLGALFIAYVLLARPRWVKDWLDRLYA